MLKHCSNLDCPALERDGVPAEYIETVSACHECGLPLVFGDRPEPSPPEYRELVQIWLAPNQIAAHLLRAALEAEDIPVSITGESLSGAVGELPATVIQVAVEVPPQYADRARQIALDLER